MARVEQAYTLTKIFQELGELLMHVAGCAWQLKYAHSCLQGLPGFCAPMTNSA